MFALSLRHRVNMVVSYPPYHTMFWRNSINTNRYPHQCTHTQVYNQTTNTHQPQTSLSKTPAWWMNLNVNDDDVTSSNNNACAGRTSVPLFFCPSCTFAFTKPEHFKQRRLVALYESTFYVEFIHLFVPSRWARTSWAVSFRNTTNDSPECALDYYVVTHSNCATCCCST